MTKQVEFPSALSRAFCPKSPVWSPVRTAVGREEENVGWYLLALNKHTKATKKKGCEE